MSTQNVAPVAYDPPAGCPFLQPTGLQEMAKTGALHPVAVGGDGGIARVVTSYDLARKILADATFSADPSREGFPVAGSVGGGVDVFSRSLLRRDEPDHLRLRQMVASYFRPLAVKGMRPLIQASIDQCLANLNNAGPGSDLVELYTSEFPSIVICRLLGIPESRRREVKEYAISGSGAVETVVDAHPLVKLGDVLAELLDADEYEDGVLRDLAGRISDGTLSRDEFISMANLLAFAGHETTAKTLGLSVALLLESGRGVIEELRESPDRIVPAVEELLRVHTVTRGGPRRIATADTTVDGISFEEGDGIIFSLQSANRDASTFDEPENVNIDRESPRRHLAFSFGLHQCLGQELARAELQMGIISLITTFSDMTLVKPTAELPYSGADRIYGVDSMPVTWSNS